VFPHNDQPAEVCPWSGNVQSNSGEAHLINASVQFRSLFIGGQWQLRYIGRGRWTASW